jgi:hypothetical protein
VYNHPAFLSLRIERIKETLQRVSGREKAILLVEVPHFMATEQANWYSISFILLQLLQRCGSVTTASLVKQGVLRESEVDGWYERLYKRHPNP